MGSQQGDTLIPVYNWHWHSKCTQNTQKCMKCINYLPLLRFSLLLPNCEGSQSAFIYKFKCKNSNTHASVEGPPCPDMIGGGASLSRWPPSVRSGVKDSGIGHNSWHVLRVTPPHEHNLTGAFVNATLLTYLLNGEILLFIQTWPSQQKRTLGDRTRY